MPGMKPRIPTRRKVAPTILAQSWARRSPSTRWWSRSDMRVRSDMGAPFEAGSGPAARARPRWPRNRLSPVGGAQPLRPLGDHLGGHLAQLAVARRAHPLQERERPLGGEGVALH